MPPLTQRERHVLTTVIENYISGAAPVGSRSVSKEGSLGLSPASIRNTMADLTEKGYLEQPHSSAGRVPTPQAFRFYLDEVMRQRPLPEAQKTRITAVMGQAGVEIGDILRQAAKILSGLSYQVGMVIAPRPAPIRWRRVELVLVKTGLVMVVLILQGGLVLKRLVTAAPEVTGDDLTAWGNYLNHHFADMTVDEVRTKLVLDIKAAENHLYAGALRLALEAFEREREREREMFLDGAANMLAQPEFSDIPHLRELLTVLEDKKRLLELLDRTAEQVKTLITIGPETEAPALAELGFITTPYGPVGAPFGAIGLLGPVRMDYAKLVPVVNFTASVLTNVLDRHF